jgi:tetratricopeptide (TPR) repeat protein
LEVNVTAKRRFLHIVMTAIIVLCAAVTHADDKNLLPKYGNLPKNQAEQEADTVFIEAMIGDYHGDRSKASTFMSGRGWQYLQQGDHDDAMRRFNQAWLLDPSNGAALWGMAAIEASSAKFDESLKLFAEAEKNIGNNLNFSIDYAKATGMAAVKLNNDVLLTDAYARFDHIYKQAPQNTLNLQNWATTLFMKGKYPEAWEKVELAEATHANNAIDPRFLSALQARMPRPQH